MENQGKVAEAIAVYEAIIVENPSNSEALEALARLYAYTENYPMSLDVYRRLLAVEPNNLEAQIAIAQVTSWSREFREAIALYRDILRENPDYIPARLGLAEVLGWVKKFTESLAEYETILDLDANEVQARVGKAQVLFWLGQTQASLELYLDTFEQFPDVPEVRLGLAKIYLLQHQISQVLAILQPLLDSEHPEALEILAEIQAIQLESRYEREENSSGELNQFLTQAAKFRFHNSNTLQRISVGVGSFQQDFFTPLNNTNVEFGIEGQIDKLKLDSAIGFDVFDRLPTVPRFFLEAEYPITTDLSLAGIVRYQAYKKNVQTLENHLAAWQFNPSLFWQIDRDTWLFLYYQLGLYNDGNVEHQFVAKAERSFGDFFVSGLLFGWSYQKDPQTGYFAPPGFFLYSGEVGWEGEVFKNTECRLSVGLGQQSYLDRIQDSFTYQARCNVAFSDDFGIELGYRHSNNPWYSGNNSGDFNQETFYGQLKFSF